MDKVEDMTHSYALTDQYMVHVEDMEGNIIIVHTCSELKYLPSPCKYVLDDHEQLTAENTDDSNHDGDKVGAPLREQDRFLPIANVAKIMKKAIPETGKVNNKVRIAFIFACCSFGNWLDIDNLYFRLQKMPENVFRNVCLSLLVLLLAKPVTVVTWRKGRR